MLRGEEQGWGRGGMLGNVEGGGTGLGERGNVGEC